MSSGTRDTEEPSVIERYIAWEPRRWPDDPEARRRLKEFLREFRQKLRQPNPLTVPVPGAELDLRGGQFDDAPWDAAWLNLARLDGVSLRNAWLHGARLDGSSLRQTDFTGAVLREASLDHADAEGAVFVRADLRDLDAAHTNLRGATFAGAALTDVSFVDADLRGADFRGSTFSGWASVENSKLAGSRWEDATGQVRGPVDISETDEPRMVDGAQLEEWFHDHGAPGLSVTP